MWQEDEKLADSVQIVMERNKTCVSQIKVGFDCSQQVR